MGQNETDLEFAAAASVSGQRGRIFMSFPNDSAAAATIYLHFHFVNWLFSSETMRKE